MAKNPRIQLVVDGKNNTKKTFGAVTQSIEALEQRTASLGRAMTASLAGIVSVATVKKLGQINSEWVDMSARLRRVTADEQEFSTVTARLGEVAESTWSGLNETIESYLSMQGPLADMGYTTEEQVNFVSALNNALVVSGAKKEVAASVQNALNKAMAGGVLRGDNLNTVIEKGGRVADLLAEKMGVTVSELRALGAQGRITGDVIYESLSSNMQLLAEEADAMPATFEDALQRVEESIKGAFRDDELMEPLNDSLLELAEVLKDPAVREGLATLAAGLATAAAAAAEGASNFAWFAKDLGYLAAAASGSVTELDRLDREIKMVDVSLNASWFGTKRSKHLFMSDEELQQTRKDLEAQRETIINNMTGTTQEMREEEEKRQAMLKEEKTKESALQRKYVNDLKEYNKKAVKAVIDRGKDLAKAEKDAAKKVLAAKSEIAALEKQFDDIRKEIAEGGDKEPSFADYQSLAASANRALSAGDTAKAKEDALAAAAVLKELAAAGENTYGFAGMVNSMEALAKSAAEINKTNAEAELEAIQLEMAELAEKAKELENMPVSMELDSESLESVKTEISKLLEQLKIEAVIPVRLAPSGSSSASDSTPGYATGGSVRGPGTGTSDSIMARLSNGEYVLRAAAVKQYGTRLLDDMNGLRIPKFATGGLVEQASNIQPQQPASIGTLQFHLGGDEAFSVDVAGSSNMDDLHRAALKFGRTRR